MAPTTPAAMTQNGMLHRPRVEQPNHRLVDDDRCRDRDGGEDQQPGEVLGPVVPVGEAPIRGASVQNEGDPQGDRREGVGEVVDRVRQQRHRPAHHHHRQLEEGGDEQGDQGYFGRMDGGGVGRRFASVIVVMPKERSGAPPAGRGFVAVRSVGVVDVPGSSGGSLAGRVRMRRSVAEMGVVSVAIQGGAESTSAGPATEVATGSQQERSLIAPTQPQGETVPESFFASTFRVECRVFEARRVLGRRGNPSGLRQARPSVPALRAGPPSPEEKGESG